MGESAAVVAQRHTTKRADILAALVVVSETKSTRQGFLLSPCARVRVAGLAEHSLPASLQHALDAAAERTHTTIGNHASYSNAYWL